MGTITCINPATCKVSYHIAGSGEAKRCWASKASGSPPQNFSSVPPHSVSGPEAGNANLAAMDRATEDVSAIGSGSTWLAQRWESLNAIEPTVPIHNLYGTGAQLDSVPKSIRTAQIVCIDNHDRWGQISNDSNPRAFQYFVGLLNDTERAASHGKMTRIMEGIQLIGVTGPQGSLYAYHSDSRHRTSMAKALELESVNARVTETDMAAVGTKLLMWGGPNYGTPVSASRRAVERVHPELLHRAGFLDKTGHEWVGTYTVARSLTCAWMLECPSTVAAISNRYAQAYPEFATNSVMEKAMLDEDTWTAWLETKAMSRVAPEDPRPASKPATIWGRIFGTARSTAEERGDLS